MGKMILFFVFILAASPGLVRAEDQIRLESGRTVKGKIVERNEDHIKMDVRGVVLTYYKDEFTELSEPLPYASKNSKKENYYIKGPQAEQSEQGQQQGLNSQVILPLQVVEIPQKSESPKPVAQQVEYKQPEPPKVVEIRSPVNDEQKKYAEITPEIKDAIEAAIERVESGSFPVQSFNLLVDRCGKKNVADIALDRMVKTIDGQEPKVRGRTVWALRGIADESTIPYLIEWMKTEEYGDRGCVEVLNGLGSSVVDPLIAAIKEDNWQSEMFYTKAATVLGYFGYKGDRRGVGILLECVNKEKYSFRHDKCFDALSQTGGEEVIEGLGALLANPEFKGKGRVKAVVALGKIRELDPQRIEYILSAKNDPDCTVRRVVADSLENMAIKERIPLLIEFLGDECTTTSAGDVLGKIKDPESIDQILAVLSQHKGSKNIRGGCFHALNRMSDRALDAFQVLLQDDDAVIREQAIKNLSNMLDSNERDRTYHLRDPKRVQQMVLRNTAGSKGQKFDFQQRMWDLEKVRSPEAVRQMLDAVGRRDDWLDASRHRHEVPQAFALAIDKHGKYAIEPLIEGLYSDNVDVRRAAATGLLYLKEISQPAVPSLIDAMKDEDDYVRGAAINALGKIKDSRGEAPLLAVFRDEHEKPELRSRAFTGLITYLKVDKDSLKPELIAIAKDKQADSVIRQEMLKAMIIYFDNTTLSLPADMMAACNEIINDKEEKDIDVIDAALEVKSFQENIKKMMANSGSAGY